MTVEVSAIVVTYRHADFIGAAIRSVLAQTGPAYEIVVSDDCSGDGTLDAARDALRETPPGIRVAIASTAGNAGLGANLNNAVAQSTGRILVACSGDDVSMPGRFAKLVEAFGAPGDGVYAVTSDAQKIDAAGRPTGVEPGWRQPGPIVAEAFATPDVSTCGAATAYRREVFDVFGPLEPGVNWEDQVLPFLAALLGKVRGCASRWSGIASTAPT